MRIYKYNPIFLTAGIILLFTQCKKSGKPDMCYQDVPATFETKTPSVQHPDKPNIILIIGDDVGYEIPAFNGGQSYSTPNLDYMAAHGMTFTHFYSHPDGFPSRLAIYTGKYNYRNYITWGYMPVSEKTIGNMMKDAGYATCFTGKWQCSGGGAGINGFGFQDYLVYLPFPANQRERRYKSPLLYSNGNYLSGSETEGLYSEDLFTSYLFQFIDNNINKPFFAVYATNLIGGPYVPTPNDICKYPDWDIAHDNTWSNADKYNNSMVAYMDKKAGEVVSKIKASGLDNNTLIMFCGDNATLRDIQSVWRGDSVSGGKTTTTWRGITNPVVAYWPGKIAPGSVTNSLIDYTDFLPTFADAANIPVPGDYGTLDGVSFYHNLRGTAGVNKDLIQCYWNNDLTDDGTGGNPPEIFVFDYDYKLYDDSAKLTDISYRYDRFFDLKNDPEEKSPLADAVLTPQQQAKKEEFIAVLKTMHK